MEMQLLQHGWKTTGCFSQSITRCYWTYWTKRRKYIHSI